MVFAGALGWYVLSGNNEPQVAPIDVVATEAEAETDVSNNSPITDDVVESSEPPFYEDTQIVELPEEETVPDVEIAADDIDPFRVADRLQTQELALADEETTSVTALKPTTSDELSNLASLLSGHSDFVPPSISDVEPADTQPRLKTSVRITMSAREIKSRLEEQITAVRFEDVALIDFLRSMTTLSGVPISLDPAALEQTAKNADAPISVAKVNGSTMEILNAALSPIGMLPILDDQVVRITTPRLEDPAQTKASLFVGDLRDGEESHIDLANFVATLCEPQTWTTAGGQGTIAIEGDRLQVSNTRLATIRTMILLEKIRAARSLPPRNKIPSHLTSLMPRWPALTRQLRRPVDIDMWQESTFTEIIAEIEQASDLRILVDWSAFVAQGIDPSASTTLYVRDMPVEEALKQLLKDRDLHLVPVDGETLQITTNAIKTSQTYVEFYSFEQLGDAGLANVEQLLLQGTAALDPASEVAIVVGNAELHRSLSQ